MKFIKILVEGPTENEFVEAVLAPYLEAKGVRPTSTILKTKRTAGRDFKGGVSSYAKIKRDLLPLLYDGSAVLVTTMLDYYGLPSDFPGYADCSTGTCFQRVACLEKAFRQNIDHPKFLPYLAIHEFESMMFAQPEAIANAFYADKTLPQLTAINDAFASPEEIDNDEPPAKRLKAIYSNYDKPFHGPLVTDMIGLEPIRASCSHFAAWLEQLEAVGC